MAIKEVYVINNDYENLAFFVYDKETKNVNDERQKWVMDNNLTKKYLKLIEVWEGDPAHNNWTLLRYQY